MPTRTTPEGDPSKFRRLTTDIRNIRRFSREDSKEWSCFNPSIAKGPKGQLAMAFRSSNYVILPHGELHVTNNTTIRNEIWFSETNEDFDLLNLRRIHVPPTVAQCVRGMEDPRLFWRGNAWHLTATMMEDHTPVARMAVCRLNPAATEIVDVKVYQGVSPKRPEKNWMTPTLKASSKFDFVYGPNATIKGDRLTTLLSDDVSLAGLRGNSHLLDQGDGTYLGVMHKLWISRHEVPSQNTFGQMDWVDKTYGHYFVRFSSTGAIQEITEPFILIRPSIEFVAGMVELQGSLAVSFGSEDVSSHVAVVDKALVLSMLRPVRSVA